MRSVKNKVGWSPLFSLFTVIFILTTLEVDAQLPPTIITSDPPNYYIDPLADRDPTSGALLGAQDVSITFSTPVTARGGSPLTIDNFKTRYVRDEVDVPDLQTGLAPDVTLVSGSGAGPYLLRFEPRIALGAWTEITAIEVVDDSGILVSSAGNRIVLGFLPMDITQDGKVLGDDIDRWLQFHNNLDDPAPLSKFDFCDQTRNGVIVGEDIIRALQLLHGNGTFQAWTDFDLGPIPEGDGRAVLPHGGSPENTVLIINPAIKESVYIGNYYKNARNIPDRNVIYMNPSAPNYATFASRNIKALFGMLENQNIADHIDYIVLAPVRPYSGEYQISDSTAIPGIGRIGLSKAYQTAFSSAEILAGQAAIVQRNHYSYSYPSPTLYAFDSSIDWSGGEPTSVTAPFGRQFISSLLGYIGNYGNSVSEITKMIDRSVLSDGTRPDGTFYFMDTGDALRNERASSFPRIREAIIAAGGKAEIIQGDLPQGHHDALGVMTQRAAPGILTADMTILPGAFGDHLTSYAGVLDSSSQEKMTNWISVGTSGTAGAVEEPMNIRYAFPGADLHYFYFKGLSLGEAYLRSVNWVAFNQLLYGDPLTRPFASLPAVSATMPSNPVSGTITIRPVATTNNRDASGISHHNLYIDGILKTTLLDGAHFTLDTRNLADGWHDIRVVSYDNSSISIPGRWTGSFEVSNHGRNISLDALTTSGDLSTLFPITVTALGENVTEIRLLQNGRVIAASSSDTETFTLSGVYLGGGPVTLVAEAEYSDGLKALSRPRTIQVEYANEPIPNSHTGVKAFSYIKYVRANSSMLVEMPALDSDQRTLSYSILQNPIHATLIFDDSSMPAALLTAKPDASGSDILKFRAVSSGGYSDGVIEIRYLP